MEDSRKKAKTCSDDTEDDGTTTLTAAQQIAELQAELERCKLEQNAMEQRHDRVVRDLKGSYSDALKWAYSVKSTPRGYWLEKGHTEEYAYAMEVLLNKFKQIIKKLRTGTADECIFIAFNPQDDEGNSDGDTAEHDDILMPYWKELANAIIHWSEYHASENELEIVIVHIETPDAVLDVLRPAVKQSKVKYVGFTSDGTTKTWRLAEFIEDVVQTNHTMTGLGFSGVMLSNEEWTSICNVIRTRNAQSSIVDYFHLTECFVGGISTEVLNNILTSKAVDIDLDGNGMSSREASIIAEHLTSNPSLDHLTLNNNRFDDDDATVLASSLSTNTNLKSVGIGKNAPMKLNGRLALLRAIFDVSSLASCAASNHTCRVWELQQDISALNIYINSSLNKWKKIFAVLALSSEDSFMNTALLNGIPASLMPLLLYRADGQDYGSYSQMTDLYLELTNTKRFQKHDVWDNLGDARPLSCVYEMMRCWVVPSIFA